KDELSDGKNRVASNFVRVRYWKEGEFHDFAFYTNVEVTENNVMELAESYRKRWGIETGYSKKKEIRLRSRSGNILLRYFLYGLSIIIYNFWIIMNILGKSMKQWIPLKDFLYFMTKGRNLEGEVYFKMLWKKMHKHPPPE
ncbi:MAG: hypothetical protein ACP5T1_06950, partial [Thermoplasmata archaeon]